MRLRKALGGAAVALSLLLTSCYKNLEWHSSPYDYVLAERDVSGPLVRDIRHDANWQDRGLVGLISRFHATPVEKFRLLNEELRIERGIPDSYFSDTIHLSSESYGLVHTEDYLWNVERRANRALPIRELFSETPITKESVELQAAFVDGTYTAAQLALDQGIAMHLGGGLHHAMPDHGEGFCIFNDVAITIRKLQQEGRIRTAAIIDLDVHHGNGNAEIFRRDNSVPIIDIYDEDNYPIPHNASNYRPPISLAIPLDTENQCPDDDLYMEQLPKVINKIKQRKPNIVFYLAGADPYKGDRLGGFCLTQGGLTRRDQYIISRVRALDIPLVVLPAGGYGPVHEVVDIHANTAQIVVDRYNREQLKQRGQRVTRSH